MAAKPTQNKTLFKKQNSIWPSDKITARAEITRLGDIEGDLRISYSNSDTWVHIGIKH